jgi:hypothetical protein
MEAKPSQRLVKQYLKELRDASRGLSRAERRELAAQIEEHIGAALALVPAPSEADVRDVLERLGEPGEIVAEQYGARAGRGGMGAQAVIAIVLLLIGGFLAGIGWIAGVVLLWTSQVWTTREKIVGTLLVPGGLATALYLSLLAGGEECGGLVTYSNGISHTVTSCTGATTTLDHVLAIALFAFLLIAPIGSAIFLAIRARPQTA